MKNKEPSFVIVSAPSGCGKDTVIEQVMKKMDHVALSVSCTTRAPRYIKKEKRMEQEGVDYFYKSEAEFKQMIEENAFYEYAYVFGKDYYGTPKFYLKKLINEGNDIIILNIEGEGAFKVKAQDPSVISIFILPPSADELWRRLDTRDSGESHEEKINRFKGAKKQMKTAYRYDYVVLNDDLDQAVDEVIAILIATKCRTFRHKKLIDDLNKQFCD